MADESEFSREVLQLTVDSVFDKVKYQSRAEIVQSDRLTSHLPGLRVLDVKMLPPDVAGFILKEAQTGRPVRVENDPNAIGRKPWSGLPSRVIGRLLTQGAVSQESQIPPEEDALNIRCSNVYAHIRRYGDLYPLGKDMPLLSVMAAQWFYTGQLKIDGDEVELSPDAVATSMTLRYPMYDDTKTDLTVVQTLHPYDDEVETESIEHIGKYWVGVPFVPFGGAYISPETMMQRAFEALAVSGSEYQLPDKR